MKQNNQAKALPPGQKERENFPRFGMPHYADFTVPLLNPYTIYVSGDLPEQTFTQHDLHALERVELTADFHCVTTWTYRGARWSGFRFADFYTQFVQPQIPEADELTFVTFTGLDRYRASMFLTDALADNVLLADRMDEQCLSEEHGAPMRLVAPAHYGYKSVKHIGKIGVWRTVQKDKRGIRKFMEHPRGRVAFEERARYFPGWLLRFAYRPLIERTVHQFERTRGVKE